MIELPAIQGGCIGGAVDMVTACDMRYASEDAFFCIQEINIGMTADVGTLQRLPKLIPEGVCRELAYMRVVVDFDLCESNAICMQIAPDIFEVRDDDFLYVLDETPSEDRRSNLEESVQRCPKQAISIEE